MRRLVRIALLVALFAFAFAAAWIRLPYYALGPGRADEIGPLIDVRGAARYPSEGRFVMTTVEYRQVTALGSLFAWIDDDRYVVGQDALFPPGVDHDLEEERAISEMDQSKITASIVVLHELTGYPEEHGRGALIVETAEDCPAAGELFVGDLVVAIDGRPIPSLRAAQRTLDEAPTTDPVEFRVRAGGEVHDVEIVREPCAAQARPLVGISMVDAFPFRIEIASGDVGGPSAGAMFALALYDTLTPGDLTGGRTIAGTGTIDADGDIGGIGGIVDKVVGAERAGATVFVVPEENVGELRDADIGDIRLIPVGSFDEAVAALEDLAA